MPETSAPMPDDEALGIRAGPRPELDRLVALTARLRGPGGCAWDADQSHASLVRYLVEETYELIDAIESGDRAELIEELGDVLYQVLFHADLAAHTPGEEFDLEDVARHMSAKMVGRHPHVFGDRVAETADDVVVAWDELKAVEKPQRTSVMDGIPQGMPALALADKVIGRAQKAGVIPASDDAAETGVPVHDEDELGGLLLAIVASARARGLDPERALRTTVRALQAEVREQEATPGGGSGKGLLG